MGWLRLCIIYEIASFASFTGAFVSPGHPINLLKDGAVTQHVTQHQDGLKRIAVSMALGRSINTEGDRQPIQVRRSQFNADTWFCSLPTRASVRVIVSISEY